MSLQRLADGTVKQVSPLTGTVVWTVPGRADRPLPSALPDARPLQPGEHDAACAFCPARVLETPPEKTRLVRDDGGSWRVLRGVGADDLDATVAAFRRIPNLFEILSFAYWRENHGYRPAAEVVARAEAYRATPAGREHVAAILRRRAGNGNGTGNGAVSPAGTAPAQPPGDAANLTPLALFAGSHDVVVARRHFVDGATRTDELCSSGDLTPDEHHRYLAFTVDGMRDLYASNPHARYVAVFQNWLRPAGASFDHLHKQLVAIDEHGPQLDRELARLRTEPDLFTTAIADPAARDRLVVAENDGAVALAGVGHRYPTVEVYATGPGPLPWDHGEEGLRAVSDLLHAVHAATGRLVPTNEEWHHRPPDAGVAMPWRVVLKWRVSTLAGFEGGTKINVNTIDPVTLRDRLVAALHDLRAAGRIAPMRIGDECSHRPGILRYAG